MHEARSQQLAHALEGFPEQVAHRLRALSAAGTCAVVGAGEAAHWAQSMGITVEQLMLQLLRWAATFANPPISKYDVGAIAQGLSGALYAGANLEFAGQALSFSLHAEQSATTNAWVHGEAGLAQLAVSAAPCGYCRQFLYELVSAARLQLLLPKRPATALTALLPDAFGPRDLGVQGGLMQAGSQTLVLQQGSRDPVVLAALGATNASYAPYSKSYSGVALQTADGAIYDGRYAENAAFNPSMSPLEAALAHLTLCGRSYADITAAALVESAGPISQRVATAAVLSTVSAVSLRYAPAVPG